MATECQYNSSSVDLPLSHTSDNHYPPEDREPRCPVGTRSRRLFYESNGDNNPDNGDNNPESIER